MTKAVAEIAREKQDTKTRRGREGRMTVSEEGSFHIGREGGSISHPQVPILRKLLSEYISSWIENDCVEHQQKM